MIKKQLFTLFSLAGLSTLGFSQNAEITSWMRNETGDLANYEFYDGPPNGGATPVQMTDSSDVKSVCYDSDDMYITANGLASYTMGPFLMNPNEPSNQNYTFKFTRNPSEETGTKTEVSSVGGVGFASNGVVLYGFGDAKSYSKKDDANVSMGDGLWETDAWVSEGETMDATGGGHADDKGAYHYHATPFALYDVTGADHSPIVGYALDGYPIYGPFGYASPMDTTSSITRMESGYELRNISVRDVLPDGSNSMPPGPDVDNTFPLGTYIQDYEYTGNGDLDEYNGRLCVTPEYPNGTYAYFLATDAAGEPAFPYILGEEYYGTVSQMDVMQAGSSTTPSGLDCYTGTILGMEDELAIDLALFPNPTTDVVIIRTETTVDAITILDINGVTHASYQPNGTSTEVNTSELESGLYFVRLVDGALTRTVSLHVVN